MTNVQINYCIQCGIQFTSNDNVVTSTINKSTVLVHTICLYDSILYRNIQEYYNSYNDFINEMSISSKNPY